MLNADALQSRPVHSPVAIQVTCATRSNAARNARRKLGAQARIGVDFKVERLADGRFRWARV